MVKNEGRIIRRCLEAATPFFDAILVSDTGSTDDTLEIVGAYRSKPCKVVHEAWRNFGVNRTLSLDATRVFVKEDLGWDLRDAYALAIDADMRLQGNPEGLREALETRRASGIHLLQRSHGLEYINVRLMLLDHPWRCEGVTHEYWTGEQGEVSLIGADVAWIDDVGDGGSKADKFQRDERLLLEGLREKPGCERYLFYLAQTYHCMGKHEEAIKWYLKRIEAGGWIEEVWFSHYMAACDSLALDRPEDAELYVQRGYRVYPHRAEGLLKLVAFFRERSSHFKAWHYLLLVDTIPKPHTGLFLELDAYGHTRDYERSILHYYIHKEDLGAGARLCLAYQGPHETCVMNNLQHYVRQHAHLRATRLHLPCPDGFVSSSVSVDEERRLCVRSVSYFIDPEGRYILRNGLVETRNFFADWCEEGRHCINWSELELDPSSVTRWTREDYIRGLEDVRICGGDFTATTREFSYCESNRMVHGAYDRGTQQVSFRPVRPPYGETACEKNWLPLGDGKVIYAWHPFQLGRVRRESEEQPAQLEITHSYETPPWCRHLRGSASPVRVSSSELWALVHLVTPSSPRHYYHAWISLEPETYKPLKYSDVFYVHHRGIEYCLGTSVRKGGSVLQLFLSVWDRESWVYELDIASIRNQMKDF
jgi:glycosyltransferase involved in cell wall biosynthesis